MQVAFTPSSPHVDTYDFIEITLNIENPTAVNPFTDVEVRGQFQGADADPVAITGFCDSQDGSVYRIRFMPTSPGEYRYSVTCRHGASEATHAGAFTANPGNRRGMVQVDPDHPWHFIWSGTGEHYFWNGTTTYWLAGWDEETIKSSIDRLHNLKVNRLRVSLSGRVHNARVWDEEVYGTDKFTFLLNPWLAKRPDDVESPDFDVSRFNVAHWRHYENLLRYAREKEMIVSVIFFLDGSRPGAYPYDRERFDDPREELYYQYAAARLSAFSNIMWDVSNEYQLFRNDAWGERMGAYLDGQDPYGHLISIHGFEEFRFRTSDWADFALYQTWDESGGNAFMNQQRALQIETGRPMPQINEEYGYEDHYPKGYGGGVVAPARSADNRRRLAWEMSMAGCYQTTGERADTGTGWGPDTGGGWVNGRGDDSMVMLVGYAHIVDIFTHIPWWRMEPNNALADNGTMVLAEPGSHYVLYIPNGGSATLTITPGTYKATSFNPRTGEHNELPNVEGPLWTSPVVPDQQDGVFLLRSA